MPRPAAPWSPPPSRPPCARRCALTPARRCRSRPKVLRLARAALARPLLVLALLAVATAAVAGGLFRLELRTDGAAIYPRDDPAVEPTPPRPQALAAGDPTAPPAPSPPR